MSRVGKIPVKVPKNVKVSIQNNTVLMEGAKGKITLDLPYGIKVEQKDDELMVARLSDVKQARANHGTVRAHLKNMIAGVLEGHKKELEIQGVGFRAQMQGKKVVFNLGFSHPVEFEQPEGVKISVPSQTSIIIEGVDKAAVGQVAAKIRDIKPPEPYKGKGIRYIGEKVRRKQGKSVGK
ncbi:MAG TPA: 50S ribosomal protein L6 [Candidatus Omnitrophota bacterium]|jgi:large subunit ribosomal protein L6|nr:50S ribosomal protein L6 [Candidatus Omnitrophota bacterium]